jgi:hypothetical protein
MISIISGMAPDVWPVLSMQSKYPELPSLFRMRKRCYFYLILRACSVCPMYHSRQSKHFIWYMPVCLCLSFCDVDFSTFPNVIQVRKAISKLVSLNSFAIYLTSFPLYVNVVHFILWVSGFWRGV